MRNRKPKYRVEVWIEMCTLKNSKQKNNAKQETNGIKEESESRKHKTYNVLHLESKQNMEKHIREFKPSKSKPNIQRKYYNEKSPNN